MSELTHCGCVWNGQQDGPPLVECHYHATLRAERDAAARDAARWRFLCNDDAHWMDFPGAIQDATGVYPEDAAAANAAVDAAIARAEGK